MSETVLQKIAAAVKIRLDERKKLVPFSELNQQLANARTPHSFIEPFLGSAIQVISEVKFRSPALGALKEPDLESALQIAGQYLSAGAAAISVLTEVDYFQGSPLYLKGIRNAYPESRLLMKDFILEEYQMVEARILGADAILLIMSLLGEARVKTLLQFAELIGLQALVEVHDEAELLSAQSISAKLIGVNNRNLKTLKVDVSTSFALSKFLKPGTIYVSESGLSQASELIALHQAGYQGFLMGSTFMQSGSPGDSLVSLLKESRE